MELPKNQIKNPLTIIAIFAGISEISGTAVLPFLSQNLQGLFIWFVMGFPVLLIGLFFYTLLRKHHVLYAPSDYKTDAAFTGLAINIRAQNSLEMKTKNDEELIEIEYDQHSDEANKVSLAYKELLRNPRVEYYIAEDLALKKLASENGDKFQPSKVFEINGNHYSVDGIINTNLQLALYEIKYFPRLKTPLSGIGKTFNYFKEISDRLEGSDTRNISFFIIIVTSISDEEKKELNNKLNDQFQGRRPLINFRIMDFTLLKNEYGLN